MRLLSILFVCVSWVGTAQESLSLEQAIEKGLQNNYQIKIGESRIQQATNSNQWAVAGKTINTNLSVSQNNSVSNNQNPNPFANNGSILFNSLNATLDASFVLYNGKTFVYNKQILEQNLENSELSNRTNIENTINSIMNAYYGVLVQEAQVKVLEDLLKLTKDRIERENVRKSLGQAGKFDIIQTQEAYYSDSISLLIQRNILDSQKRNLNLTMGEDDVLKKYELTDEMDLTPKDWSIEALESQLFAQNTDLQSLRANQRIQELNIKLNQAQKKPTISVNGGINTSVNTSKALSSRLIELFGNGFQQGYNATPYLNFSLIYNLTDGGVRDINVQNAKIENEVLTYSIQDTERTLKNNLNDLVANYNNQKSILEITKLQVENAAANLSISEERFNSGLISSFDYRNVQLAYQNANQNLFAAQYNLKVTEISIERLIGGLVK